MSTWRPRPDEVERARVTQLARHLGVAEGGIAAVRSLAVEQPARFWAGVVEDLELPFLSPWETVLDASDGVAFPRCSRARPRTPATCASIATPTTPPCRPDPHW